MSVNENFESVNYDREYMCMKIEVIFICWVEMEIVANDIVKGNIWVGGISICCYFLCVIIIY